MKAQLLQEMKQFIVRVDSQTDDDYEAIQVLQQGLQLFQQAIGARSGAFEENKATLLVNRRAAAIGITPAAMRAAVATLLGVPVGQLTNQKIIDTPMFWNAGVPTLPAAVATQVLEIK